MNQINQINKTNQIDQTNETDQMNQINLSRVPHAFGVRQAKELLPGSQGEAC